MKHANRSLDNQKNAFTSSTHYPPGVSIIRLGGSDRPINRFLIFMSVCVLIMTGLAFVGCGPADDDGPKSASGQSISSSGNICAVSTVRYPTTAGDFSDDHLLYGNRGFLRVYQDSKHLGRDIIYPAGKEIHPIACGKLVWYGPATGYGTLVAVVEHRLETPIEVENGDSEMATTKQFLSIYGHGSKTDPMGQGPNLTWKAGDTVGPDDVLMYIQTNASNLNGDGPEHLHMGIRIQSASEAQDVDPYAWFRGNDTAGDGIYKKYFTDPAMFIPALMMHAGQPFPYGTSDVTHHPLGTLLYEEAAQKVWMVVDDYDILDVTKVGVLPRDCMVHASVEELACYRIRAFDPMSMYLDAQVITFDGHPEVYQLLPGAGFSTTAYRVFLSYESFLSWGYTDADLEHFPFAEKALMLAALDDWGSVGMMPGTLVKGKGQSEVAIAQQRGQRTPIFHWDVFEALGYGLSCIYEIEPTTLNVVAGVRSEDLLEMDDALACDPNGSQTVCEPGDVTLCQCTAYQSGIQQCLDDGKSFGPCACESGPGGSSDPPELCNGVDDDHDGQVDETFECVAGMDGDCTTSCGSPGFRSCHPTECTWLECHVKFFEICDNGLDEDCDGDIDCDDVYCATDPACQGTGGASGSGGAANCLCQPGASFPCATGGEQYCLADCVTVSACPNTGTGGTSGSGGTSGAGGTGGSACVCQPGTTLTCPSGDLQYCLTDCMTYSPCPSVNTGGSGGTSGTGGASGTGGTGGSDPWDLTSVTLHYQGPSWSHPEIIAAWGSRPWGPVDGCQMNGTTAVSCTFDVPNGQLSNFLWQVSCGNNRYWGDTSGVAPAPCIPEAQVNTMSGTSLTVIGTVSLELNGTPTVFRLCSNGILNPNYSNMCGESPFPYMNGCL